MATVIAKGTVITNPTDDNVGKAQFVHCVATSNAQTVIVEESDGSTVLGQVYLHLAGDSVVIEKHPEDEITLAAGKVSAVGSPRS